METYLRDLMAQQQRSGKQVHALVHASIRALLSTQSVLAHGEQCLTVTRAGILGVMLFTPISPGFGLQLRRLIRQFRPAVLHLHVPNVSAFWVLMLPCAKRLPVVLHWHADVPRSQHSLGLRLFQAAYSLLERALLRRAQAIICTSAAYRDSSPSLRPFLAKCHVVPLGLDPPTRATRHPETGTATKAPNGAQQARMPATLEGLANPEAAKATPDGPLAPLKVLYVGRLSYYKGLQVLLAAISLSRHAQLRLVGSGDELEALQRSARKLGLQHRVVFVGHVTPAALHAEYEHCDCVCLASIERTEAFGLVLAEAMYHGKACVAADVPGSGMSWVVQHEQTGLLVPPGEAPALARAFDALAGSRDKLGLYGRAGRERFLSHLHIAQSESGVATVYAALVTAATSG
jgi:rhamnosyl/mannosyltransferase